MLPAIGNNVIRRDGDSPKTHYIPNGDDAFWNCFYRRFIDEFKLVSPIDGIINFVNPYFGRFGYRWHPVLGKPRYFHIGIDAHIGIGTPVKAVADGLFEYSGFAPVNGVYTVMSHPGIVTADGFVMNSVYMHCDAVSYRFNLLQKIVRRYVSTAPIWVNKRISKSDIIAVVGNTGIEDGYSPHLHLQIDFVSVNKAKRVSVDPMRLFGYDLGQNLSSNIKTKEEFRRFYYQNYEDLTPWTKFIESYL